MAKTRRLCRRSARTDGRIRHQNYQSNRAYAHAKKRRALQKAGRKAARLKK